MSKRSEPRITLYSTPRCPHCHQARTWLLQRKLRFRDLDIERNARALKEFQRLGARSVPVLVINGERIDGYDPKRMQRLLA